jgi:hypothetical protein
LQIALGLKPLTNKLRDLLLIVAGISTVIGFVGVGLVLHGNITIGALTSIGSFLATNELKKIAAEANLRVDRLLQGDQKDE